MEYLTPKAKTRSLCTSSRVAISARHEERMQQKSGRLGSGQNKDAGCSKRFHQSLELLRLHESLAGVLTWGSPIFFVLWIFFFFRNMENKRIDHLALAFLGLLSAIALATGYLGIQLVYTHGVGTP